MMMILAFMHNLELLFFKDVTSATGDIIRVSVYFGRYL